MCLTLLRANTMIRFHLLSLMFLSSAAFSAQVYKWVDENGQTQFSQFPPTSQQQSADKVDIKTQRAANPEASKKLDTMRQKLLESSVDRNTQSEKDKEAVKEAEALAENCKRAEQHLRDLQDNGRIYKTQEDGERYWYSEKEREGLIQKAKDQVAKFCK